MPRWRAWCPAVARIRGARAPRWPRWSATPIWLPEDEISDERRVMDLVFTIGGYRLPAMAVNTFGVVPEHE